MFTEHVPSSDLSQKELQGGYWIATHRSALHTVGIGVVSLFAAVSVGALILTTIQWLTHLESTAQIEQYLLTQPVQFAAASRPQPLQSVRSFTVRRDETHVDAVIQLSNPNATWGAMNHVVEVVIGGQSAGSATVSIAPGHTWIITRLNVPWTDAILPRAEFITHSAPWRRMPDVNSLIQDTWEYADASFGYVDGATSTSVFQSELSFSIRNTSVVGFREPEVVVLLQDDTGAIAAVGSTVLTSIDSLESRTVRVLWPQRYPRSLTPVISVNVDKMNEDRIIRPTVDVSS